MALFSLAFMYILFITSIHTHNHHHQRPSHQCSHDHTELIKGENIHEIHVPYKNHPYDRQTHPTHRRLSSLTESNTAPIRMRAYYDPAMIAARSSAEISQLKSVIGALSNYYSNAIRVIPVDGTWYFPRYCNNWWCYPSCSSLKYTNCYKYSSITDLGCLRATIPDSHLREDWLYNNPNNDMATVLSGGAGIQDTDLMIYITNDDTTSTCSGSSWAHAGACAYDQYGRPMAGNINLCNQFWENNSGKFEWKKEVEFILHELSHITIMSAGLWGKFKDSSGNTIAKADVYDTTVDPPILKSPILLQTVRDHFNCPTASGYPVQSTSSAHWHTRYAYSETLNANIYTQQMSYSKFTLALMEDSGWYLPNYEYAEPYYFGLNAGCSFLTDDCIDTTTHSSNFPQWYCDSAADDGCNQDNSAPANCYYINWRSTVTPQWFADSRYGGSSYADRCPWRDPGVISNTADDYESVCWDIRGNTLETGYQAETWGAASRCVDIKSTNGGNDVGYCFEHSCYGWDGTEYAGVDIKFSNSETVRCARSDELSEKTLSSVSNKALTCPIIDIVCGTNSNFGSCYWGHYSDTEQKCVCSPGYTGVDCNTIDDGTDVDVGTVSVTIAPEYAPSDVVCLSGFSSTYSKHNGEWGYIVDSEQTWIYPAYQKSSYYLWWNPAKHAWFITTVYGDETWGYRDCQCFASEFTENIADCTGYWQCKIANAMAYETNAGSLFGNCPAVPTKEPTKNPSKAPTMPPTPRPTAKSTAAPSDNPTPSPTSNPSPAPTDYPTPAPTKQPTPSPTEIPTPSPTENPTSTPSKAPTTPDPTASPVTKAPTLSGYTYPPSTDPTPTPSDDLTLSPTAYTEGPTLYPTILYTIDIEVDLQYENDNECDAFRPDLANLTIEFTTEYIDEQDPSLQYTMNLVMTDDIDSSLLTVIYSVSSSNKYTITILNTTITSQHHTMELMLYLTQNVDDCFHFIYVSSTEANIDNLLANDNLVNIFEFNSYGTTEILVVTLAALIFCVVVGVCCCIICACKRKEERSQNTMDDILGQSISETNSGGTDISDRQLMLGQPKGTTNSLTPENITVTTPSGTPRPALGFTGTMPPPAPNTMSDFWKD